MIYWIHSKLLLQAYFFVFPSINNFLWSLMLKIVKSVPTLEHFCQHIFIKFYGYIYLSILYYSSVFVYLWSFHIFLNYYYTGVTLLIRQWLNLQIYFLYILLCWQTICLGSYVKFSILKWYKYFFYHIFLK